jgi:hypothetical protein
MGLRSVRAEEKADTGREVGRPPSIVAAEALFKFLAFADVDRRPPPGYDEVTEYYDKSMIVWNQYETEAFCATCT